MLSRWALHGDLIRSLGSSLIPVLSVAAGSRWNLVSVCDLPRAFRTAESSGQITYPYLTALATTTASHQAPRPLALTLAPRNFALLDTEK